MNLPEDIREKALKLAYDVRDEVTLDDYGDDGVSVHFDYTAVCGTIEAALLAERLSATERAAKIADRWANRDTGRAIAAAIRSQDIR